MAEFIETELKLYVPDLKAVERRLMECGAECSAVRVLERNHRYGDARGEIQRQGVVLRLRQDSRVRLTYKTELAGGEPLSRYEAEVEVSSFEAMDAILRRLGFHTVMIYEKYRTTYALYDAEIVLDELPFGTFVEIEGDRAGIKRVVDALNLTGATPVRASYSVLFDRLKQQLNLDMRDLTFDAFRSLMIDPQMLLAADIRE